MRKYYLLWFWLLGTSSIVFAQKNVDSLLQESVDMTRKYVYQNIDSALFFAENAMTAVESTSNDSLKASVLANRIFVEIEKYGIQADEKMILQLIEEIEKLAIPEVLAQIQNNYGGYLRRQGKLYPAHVSKIIEL